MVLDSSAVIAILAGEPPAARLVAALERALSGHDAVRISTGTLLEAGIVAEARWGEAGGRELDALLTRLDAQTIAVTAEQTEHARDAFRRFGKGRHPAGLNFGDCFAYALAVTLNEPLLFVGDDFSRTDVLVAEH